MKSSRDSYTTSDVAKICRVSTRIVTKWFDNKLISGYRLPDSKHRRFTYENIRSFMEKQDMPLEWLEEVVESETQKPQSSKVAETTAN